MGPAIWHYIDAGGAQIGPVPAETLRGALRSGAIGPATLAWRDGLGNWAPISQLAGELGLPIGRDDPPPAPGAHDPYLPPEHSGSPERIDRHDVVPAGFIRRWAALFIDQLIIIVPLSMVIGVVGATAFAGLANEVEAGETASAAFVLVFYLGYWIVAALYYSLQESSAAQATLGKRALGIKVADLDGRRIGFGQALGRWFAASLSYLTLYIGFLMAAFTERKRALHDFVAGTQVVDRWAYTASPERQKRGLSGCLVVFLIVMLLLPIGAILAALSISQYQEYVQRAQGNAP